MAAVFAYGLQLPSIAPPAAVLPPAALGAAQILSQSPVPIVPLIQLLGSGVPIITSQAALVPSLNPSALRAPGPTGP